MTRDDKVLAALCCMALASSCASPGPGNAGLSTSTHHSVLALPETMNHAEARACMDRAMQWLVSHQNKDGSWGSSVMEGLLDSQYSVAS